MNTGGTRWHSSYRSFSIGNFRYTGGQSREVPGGSLPVPGAICALGVVWGGW